MSKPEDLVEVPVKGLLEATCGYLTGKPQRYCRKKAMTAVEYQDGSRHYRCDEHEGLIKGKVTGPVHETITLCASDPRLTPPPKPFDDSVDLSGEW